VEPGSAAGAVGREKDDPRLPDMFPGRISTGQDRLEAPAINVRDRDRAAHGAGSQERSSKEI